MVQSPSGGWASSHGWQDHAIVITLPTSSGKLAQTRLTKASMKTAGQVLDSSAASPPAQAPAGKVCWSQGHIDWDT
jgi:hypothetical protein